MKPLDQPEWEVSDVSFDFWRATLWLGAGESVFLRSERTE